MNTLTNEQLDMLCELVPDFQPSPKGGRPPVSKRGALVGIFWVLDNRSKWNLGMHLTQPATTCR